MALGDYYEFEEDEVQTTTEEREESFQELHGGQTWEDYSEERGLAMVLASRGLTQHTSLLKRPMNMQRQPQESVKAA